MLICCRKKKKIDYIQDIQQQYFNAIAESCKVDVLVDLIISYAPLNLKPNINTFYGYRDPVMGRYYLYLKEATNPWTKEIYQIERKFDRY